MIKAKWTEQELANAWYEIRANRGENFRDFMDVLTAQKLRDDIPVMYKWNGEPDCLAIFGDLSPNVTNVRALITTDDAGLLAKKAAKIATAPGKINVAMAMIDEYLHAYKYGEVIT